MGGRAVAGLLFLTAFLHDLLLLIMGSFSDEPMLFQLVRSLLIPAGWVVLGWSEGVLTALETGWVGLRPSLSRPGSPTAAIGGRLSNDAARGLPRILKRAAIGLFPIVILAHAYWGGRLLGGDSEQLQPVGLGTLIGVHLWGIGLTLLGCATVGLITRQLLFRRQRTTRRNLNLLWFAVGATALSTLGRQPGMDVAWWTDVLLVASVALIGFNALRLSWIVYQPRKEKLATLGWSVLLMGLFGAISGVIATEEAGHALELYSFPMATVIRLSLILGAVYSAATFFGVLFHLPTARAFERQAGDLASLHGLSRLLTDVLDIDRLAGSVVDAAASAGHTTAWLERCTADGWILAAQRGITLEEIGKLAPLMPPRRDPSAADVTVAPAVDRLRDQLIPVAVDGKLVPTLVADAAVDPRLVLAARAPELLERIASLIVVPLVARERLTGLLYVGSPIAYGFEGDDVSVLSAFADQAAIALENARLFADTLDKERLEGEMRTAQQVQQNLLPHRVPTLPGLAVSALSYPAYEVGGDYYDFAELPEGQLGAIVGDVSGKGTSAAFYMAELKGIFQCLSPEAVSPKTLLVGANRAIARSMDRKTFVSVAYAVLDPATGVLSSARAGHCPILVTGPERTEYIRSRGLGLGLDPGGRLFAGGLEEHRMQLRPGESVVLYTDGVVEAMTPDGEEYGYERLAAAVAAVRGGRSADQIRHAVLNDLSAFLSTASVAPGTPGAGRLGDDLTLVVLTWTGPTGRSGTDAPETVVVSRPALLPVAVPTVVPSAAT